MLKKLVAGIWSSVGLWGGTAPGYQDDLLSETFEGSEVVTWS